MPGQATMQHFFGSRLPHKGPMTSGLRRYAVLLVFGMAVVFAWVAWTSHWDSGLYGDNVEQFSWAHSLELGYYKHPPLPTWLMGLALFLVGPHWWVANALAAVCIAGTGLFTWLTARRLCGERIANVAVVLWGLQQSFSVSAEIYNHNTVLVLVLAATAYTAVRALSSAFDTPWWLASGGLAALAMQAKYQAALPLAALLIAVAVLGHKRVHRLPLKITFVLLAFFVFFSPHLYWSISNDFPSLRYASGTLESGGLARRAFWVTTFVVNQIRLVLPLLLALALCALLARRRARRRTVVVQPAAETTPAAGVNSKGATFSDREISIWMACLVWGPIFTVMALSLLTGSALRNHWGVQLFQFLSIWIAWRWRDRAVLRLATLMAVALLVHTIGFAYYVVKQSDPSAVLAERRADSAYPAQRLSDAAVAHWAQATHCPLRIVVGDFEAGLVSVYARQFPVVFTGAVETPWVTPEQLNREGALYVLDQNTALPADVTAPLRWSLVSGSPEKYVQFALRLPAKACSVAAAG